jgi:hypothetical protein
MGTKTVKFSDLTNNIIDDDDVVRIVVEQHPALEDGPVEIEASKDEVDSIRSSALNVVTVKLYQGDGTEPETITMQVEAFDKLAQGMDMADVIRRAGLASAPRRSMSVNSAASAADKLDYTTLEHAGKPHRGKTTNAEKQMVRDNLEAINERLKRDGMRTIDLDNDEHVARYGLEDLAKEAGTSHSNPG